MIRRAGSGRSCRHHRGLTLLEVMIAIALWIALFGAVFSFMHSILATRERSLTEASRQRAINTMFTRMERDLFAGLAGDQLTGAGIEGDEHSISIATRAVPVTLAERGVGDPSVVCDLQRSSYRFDPASGHLRARRQHDANREIGETADSDLGGPVGDIRFRYLRNGIWRDRFDTLTSGGLPEAIEIRVWFEPWREEGDFDLLPVDDPAARSGPGSEEPEPDRVRVIPLVDAVERDTPEGAP